MDHIGKKNSHEGLRARQNGVGDGCVPQKGQSKRLRMKQASDPVHEPLKPIQYDFKLEAAYQYYRSLRPLDIGIKEVQKQKGWFVNNQYSKLVFAQLVDVLQRSANLNDFIDNSMGDFDNLALVIESAVAFGFVSVNQRSGAISNTYKFNLNRASVSKSISKKFILPKKKFNQFPCNDESRARRVELLRERYPFTVHLRFGMIGDDDLLSIQFKKDFWAWPVVVETDSGIVQMIKNTDSRVKIYRQDVRDFKKLPSANLQTFITDPPYTLNGALSFISAGLTMLTKDPGEKEFYVIMNETMMGRSLLKLQKVLSGCGVYLTCVTENFSQYELPKNFSERQRADIFMKKMKISPRAITLSSSSNLYIFKTTEPDINKLRKSIDLKVIYEHY